jgi:hypothetical protein
MISDVSVGVWGAVSPHQKMKGSPWELSPLDDSFPTIKQALIQIYRHCAVRTHVAVFFYFGQFMGKDRVVKNDRRPE